ncbi:MAG: FHA domain-containing protein [Pyrinomonadaceae bacterium]
MPSHFTLTFDDEDGRRRVAAVDKARFRVGRGEENDLRLGVAGLSRRHALLELVGGRLYLSDAGSSNGTTVNGEPVVKAVEVCDGDVIVLGDTCALRVSAGVVNGAAAAEGEPDAPAAEAPNVPPPAPEAPAAKPSAFGPHLFVGGIVGLVLLACVVLLALHLGGAGRSAAADEAQIAVEEEAGGTNSNLKVKADAGPDNGGASAVKTADAPARDATSADSSDTPTQPPVTTQPSITTQPSMTTQPSGDAAVRGSTGAAGAESERDAVKRVLGRISNDDSAYISEEGVRDVARKVKEYGGSAALAGRMRAMASGCAEVASLARANNLRPSLLAYAALAESEAGGGDPVAAARRMAPKLLTLRATFGTETANSSLLLVAAYPYPFEPAEGERKHRSHPLAAGLVKLGGEHPEVEASVARTVWFLREQKAVTPEAYGLVVRLLAVGVIAQRPGAYGVEAPPLRC